MIRLLPAFTAILLAFALPVRAVENTDLLAACRTVMANGGVPEICGCFVRIAGQEMSPLQREVLYMHLSGRDNEAAQVLGQRGPAYAQAMQRMSYRVAQECQAGTR